MLYGATMQVSHHPTQAGVQVTLTHDEASHLQLVLRGMYLTSLRTGLPEEALVDDLINGLLKANRPLLAD